LVPLVAGLLGTDNEKKFPLMAGLLAEEEVVLLIVVAGKGAGRDGTVMYSKDPKKGSPGRR